MRFLIFQHLSENLRKIFSFRNIFLQLLACVLTYGIVISGFDWVYFMFTQSTPISSYFFPAIVIGGFIPVFGIPALYVFSRITKRKEDSVLVWALAQSATLGWVISSVYKAFTGRVQPQVLTNTLIDTSRDWNFGFLEHGIFWGWPSSHTTVAFAMTTTLIALYPKQKLVVYSALIYAFYIGIGVSTRIHWFSEFIAGAIIGAIIGTIVGKSFK